MESSYYERLSSAATEEDVEVRKGPWMVEEDTLLFDYVTVHGEGRWNSVAHTSGLKRTGKSCRLRWLNYLRPNVRRGNISLEEQLVILDLHSQWGNRWSKIAQHLPGRTDNEIKNYWRTRVQKQAKQMKCDVNSKQFRDALRYVWMPRLMERIQAQHQHQQQQQFQYSSYVSTVATTTTTTTTIPTPEDQKLTESPSEDAGADSSEEEESVWKYWSQEDIWFLQHQLFD